VDFVEMAATAYSNVVDRHHAPEREARYMDIVKRYTKAEVDRFCFALASLVACYERVGFDDVLGRIYMELELGNKWAGQFFTPYQVSRAMARMTLAQDLPDKIAQHGFVTANDPATGGGAMVIALAEEMQLQGFNYQTQLHVTAQDIDIKAVHMAYIQFTLLHIPAVIIHGNTLLVETREVWYTPAHILGGWTHKLKLRRQELLAARRETPATSPEVRVAAAA